MFTCAEGWFNQLPEALAKLNIHSAVGGILNKIVCARFIVLSPHQIFCVYPHQKIWTLSLVKLGSNYKEYQHAVTPIRLLREVNYVYNLCITNSQLADFWEVTASN